MALPSNISYGLITGRFLQAVGDSAADSDRFPDGLPITGMKIRFTASVSVAKNASATPPATVFFQPIEVVTDVDGDIIDANGEKGIYLVATNDPDLTPTNFTYNVYVKGPVNSGISDITFNISVPAGSTIDLATAVPVPSNPGQTLTDWVNTLTRTEAARDLAIVSKDSAATSAASAQAAADEAESLRDEIVSYGTTNDSIIATKVADPTSLSYAAVNDLVRPGRGYVPSHISRMFPGYLAKWHAGVRAVLQGDRDAKVLIIGDSTAGGVGGGTASTFIQAGSWPSLMVSDLNRLVAPTSHGLAVPPSNSGAVTAPYDTRWSLGSGWAWRKTGTLDGFIGFGGKGTNIQTLTATAPLVFQDSRILADSFDVYLAANSGPTGATFSIQATGGIAVTGQTFSQSSQHLMKVTVKASSASTTNSVSITRTGGTGTLYVVGVEPFHSLKRRIRVANAGISGSNTNGWVTTASGSPWHGVQFIKDYAPDLTIIDLGINDADPAGLIPPATYSSNMLQLIQAAQASGDVILKSMIPSDSTRFSNEQLLVAELDKFDLPFVDTFGYYGSWEASRMTDSVHGNSAMYTDEADYMTGVLYNSRPSTSGPYVDPSTALHSLPVTGFNRRFVASQLTGVDGSSVASWTDLSGSGTALTPGGVSGANTAPVIATDGGRKVVSFDGANSGTGQDLAMSQPHTVVIVGRFTAITAASVQTLSGGIGSGSRANLYIDGTAPGNLRLNGGSTLVGPAIDTNWHVFVGVFDTTSTIRIDSVEVSAAAGSNSRTKLTIGSLDGASKGSVNVAEVITYPYALDVNQRSSIVADLRSYYNI